MGHLVVAAWLKYSTVLVVQVKKHDVHGKDSLWVIYQVQSRDVIEEVMHTIIPLLQILNSYVFILISERRMAAAKLHVPNLVRHVIGKWSFPPLLCQDFLNSTKQVSPEVRETKGS